MKNSDKRLLATDLDGTFIGDDRAMFDLWDLLGRREILVAFSTGRHLRSIESFYDEKKTERRANVCVCMVGTDIYFRNGQDYQLDHEWHRQIQAGWEKQGIETILQALPELQMQDLQWQSSFKSSYFLEQDAPQRLEQINAGIREAGLQAKVVYSADKFLDLLPIRSGKGEAVRYVAEKLGVQPQHVVTCGDTGNDLDMMRAELGFRSIAVGNATTELKSLRDPHVYHARASFAAGILEGLSHWGWL